MSEDKNMSVNLEDDDEKTSKDAEQTSEGTTQSERCISLITAAHVGFIEAEMIFGDSDIGKMLREELGIQSASPSWLPDDEERQRVCSAHSRKFAPSQSHNADLCSRILGGIPLEDLDKATASGFEKGLDVVLARYEAVSAKTDSGAQSHGTENTHAEEPGNTSSGQTEGEVITLPMR